MAESNSQTPDISKSKSNNHVLENTSLNESDSEFLSALEQVFTIPSQVTKPSETPNNSAEFVGTNPQLNHNAEIKPLPSVSIEKDKNSLPTQNSANTPRIETFLHTPTIKQPIEPPTTDQPQLVELNVPQLKPTEPTPVSTDTTPTRNSLHHLNYRIKSLNTLTPWLAALSLIIASLALWQTNELYEQIFRIETMNQTLESKLLETLSRIDIIKDKFIQIDQHLHQLEQQPTIAPATSQ